MISVIFNYTFLRLTQNRFKQISYKSTKDLVIDKKIVFIILVHDNNYMQVNHTTQSTISYNINTFLYNKYSKPLKIIRCVFI